MSPEPWRIVVELPRAGNQYHAKTARLGIWIDGADNIKTRSLRGVVAGGIAERIRALEARNDIERPFAADRRAHGTTPNFYLVPGHMGDPDDLSLRALQVLASVPIIFVEHNKSEEVRAVLARFALRPVAGPGAPEIVELRHDDPWETSAVARWQSAVAAGLDTCLFGANEGIPGFYDPGKALVIAAAAMPDGVRTRSVGGSSALGHALMRVPSWIEAFEFGGLLYGEKGAGSLAAALARSRLPLVAFSRGSAVREYLPEVIRRSGLRKGAIHILAVITGDDEQAHAMTVADFVPPGPESLPDYQAVVIIIEPGRTAAGKITTLLRRVIARFRGER